MVVGQNSSSRNEKNILPYMVFLYKSHLREKKVQNKQKHQIYQGEPYDFKYNLTKELVRENLIQARKEKKRGMQAYELGLMYDKLASEKEKKTQGVKKTKNDKK